MKKIKLLLTAIFLFVFVIFPLGQVYASELDQSNDTGAIADINILGHSGTCWQTFKPSMPKLDYATVYLNNGGGDNAVLRIVRASDETTLMSSTVSVAGDSWYTVSGTSVTVTPGETLKVVVSTGSATMQWRWGAANYTNGEAYDPNAVPDRDFYFRTYGTPATPAPTPTPSATTSPAPGSGVVGSIPAATTDPLIKPATDLKGADVSDIAKNEPKLKLTWEASETINIDGYRLYNKLDPADDFALVVEVNKETKEYIDNKVKFDQGYTYMVRAYKGSKESESSNEAFLAPKKERADLNSIGFLSFADSIWKQWQFWVLVALGLAIIGFVIWYIVDRKKRKKVEGSVETIKN